MKKHLFLVFLLLFSLTLFGDAFAQITGTFKGNGKDAKLQFLNARKGEVYSGEETVLLVFTEKDPGADPKPDFKAIFGDYGSALVVKITKSGNIYGTEIYHTALSKKPFSAIGPIKLEGFKWDATGVSGKLNMTAPDEFFGDIWQVNLDFKSPVKG